MKLNDWYKKGISPDEYILLLDKHKDAFGNIYKNFSLPDDQAFFQSLAKQNLRVLVLAEVWCGHCMLDIPILLHLAHRTNMPVRILARDENLELMDQYLTNGTSRSVPIFIFIDEFGNEITTWGPVAEPVKEFVNKHRAQLPAKDDKNYDDAFKELIGMTSKAFSEDKHIWHEVYKSIKNTLAKHVIAKK